MTIAPVQLFGGSVPDAATIIYTVPSVTTVTVTRVAVTNISAAGANLTLWVVRAGINRANGYIVFGATAAGQTIAAGPATPTVIEVMAGRVLEAGDTIHALSSVTNALNIVGSGWKQT